MNGPLFRYPDIALPTVLAIVYAVGGYIFGFLLLSNINLWFPLGVLLLAHSMVIAAFLLHECAHGSLFARQSLGGLEPHRALGLLLTWLTGSCYSDFDSLRDKHLRHHFERADIVALDYRRLLAARPLLRKIIEVGQRWYLPAVELLFHGLAIVRPLIYGKNRGRVTVVLVLRLLFFYGIASMLGWQALLGYALAYMLFITVMGFMDAFQHQYLLLIGLEQPRSQSPTMDRERFAPGYFSREYEQQHTFSNLISRRWPQLNWLVLNFCYHNAHHLRPAEPWYHLPHLHKQLLESPDVPVVIPFSRQLRSFFRYRVERVMAPATDHLEPDPSQSPGAAGVSFLTPL